MIFFQILYTRPLFSYSLSNILHLYIINIVKVYKNRNSEILAITNGTKIIFT